jgi:hypothetical protein
VRAVERDDAARPVSHPSNVCAVYPCIACLCTHFNRGGILPSPAFVAPRQLSVTLDGGFVYQQHRAVTASTNPLYEEWLPWRVKRCKECHRLPSERILTSKTLCLIAYGSGATGGTRYTGPSNAVSCPGVRFCRAGQTPGSRPDFEPPHR